MKYICNKANTLPLCSDTNCFHRVGHEELNACTPEIEQKCFLDELGEQYHLVKCIPIKEVANG